MTEWQHGQPRTHDPMNALELTLIRIGFLAVLWLFVIAAVGVVTNRPVRTDLRSAAGARAAPPQPAPPPARPAQRQARPADRGRRPSSCW